MSEANPFRLEKDNKRFFQTVARNSILEPQRHFNSSEGMNRIKKLNQQIEQLAKEREEVLFKDAQVNYIFKKQKPIIKLEDYIDKEKEKKKKNIIKEKKETLHQYINKKKEIFISKMNINIKKEETNKLQDYIKDQQETLRARQLYYKNDVEFMNNFITQVKKEAEAAQPKAEELAFAQNLTRTLTSLEIQIQKKQNLISKAQDDFKNLSKYQQFLDKFTHLKNSSWKPYTRRQEKQDMFFLTQGESKPQTPGQKSKISIPFSPQNLLQIFNQILQNNLSEIQTSHDAQSELQKIIKQERKIKQSNEKTQQQYKDRLHLLQKSLANQTKRNQKLKQMKRNNTTKIKITDNQDLDVEKIGNKIIQIYKEIVPKNKTVQMKPTDSKQLKNYMKEIQHEIIRLNQQIEKEKQIDPTRNEEIQNKIKQNYKKQNQLRKQQITKQIETKKLNEQTKKRQQSELHFQKGRRDMAKVLVQKPSRVKRVVMQDSHDKDQKYFKNQNSSQDQG